jgi:cytochrome P450
MTGFYPPYPKGNKKKLNPIRRFFNARDNLLNVFYDKNYDMKLGESWALNRRLYFPNQHDLVDFVLKDPIRFPKSNLMGEFLDQLLGDSIFITNGKQWSGQREMMAPSLEHARIQATFDTMVSVANAMIERMKPFANDSCYFVDHEMTHVTADVIFRTIFSKSMTKENSIVLFEAFGAYQELAYAHGISTLAGLSRYFSPQRLRARKYVKAIRGVLEEYVDHRLNQADGQNNQKDILQSLIDAVHPKTGERFKRNSLVDQVGTMFFAGHETSASALSWALYLISNVPDVAHRVQAEADLFWSETPKFGNLKLLKFTRDVFRETVRLYPPVAMLQRDTVQKEQLRDKTVAKGSIVMISPWLMHRQRSVWKDPDMFDPDRFSDPSQDETIRNYYLPFSKGPRVCLGASFALQEAVIILSSIMRNFDISAVKEHIPEPVARLTLRPINGVAVRLHKR